MTSTKRKTLALGLALMLAVSIGTVGVKSAFAAPTTGQTSVFLKADESQIDVTVPAEMTASINADGTLLYPTDAKFINESIFGIHVASLAATPETDYQLVSQTDFATSTADNKLWTEVTPSGGTTAVDLSAGATLTDGEWNIAKKPGIDDGTNELGVAFDGAIGNLDGNFSIAPLKAYTIVWTVAPGSK